jgi:hypothetical protein
MFRARMNRASAQFALRQTALTIAISAAKLLLIAP